MRWVVVVGGRWQWQMSMCGGDFALTPYSESDVFSITLVLLNAVTCPPRGPKYLRPSCGGQPLCPAPVSPGLLVTKVKNLGDMCTIYHCLRI